MTVHTSAFATRSPAMPLRSLILPAAALLAAGLLTAPPRAFTVTGDLLPLEQRDARVFDNFTDPEAHSNSFPDPSFPGYSGPALALWKACVEWGSELHFEGNGDPAQPGDLGSGGANFDPTWQGHATSVGGPDDNVMSEISGNGAGVLAFTETPTSDGWRIRFYALPWVWHDKPAGVPLGFPHADLQGIACHEYGHALGLGHSSDPQATMLAFAPPDMTAWRSIEQDDRDGVQFVYGPRSTSKPSVARYVLLPQGAIRIEGSGFAPLANEVWFTQAGSGGDGTPVKALGLASSSGGTELTLVPPAAAGPGDLLVRVPGSSGAALSNAFPFAPGENPCYAPKAYGTGKTTSSGSVATIDWTGSTSVAQNGFQVTAHGLPAGQGGVVFWGAAPQSTPFLGGHLLVQGPLQRGPKFTTDLFGFASVPIPLDPSWVDVTLYVQCWFSDPADPAGAGTTSALAVTFCK